MEYKDITQYSVGQTCLVLVNNPQAHNGLEWRTATIEKIYVHDVLKVRVEHKFIEKEMYTIRVKTNRTYWSGDSQGNGEFYNKHEIRPFKSGYNNEVVEVGSVWVNRHSWGDVHDTYIEPDANKVGIKVVSLDNNQVHYKLIDHDVFGRRILPEGSYTANKVFNSSKTEFLDVHKRFVNIAYCY